MWAVGASTELARLLMRSRLQARGRTWATAAINIKNTTTQSRLAVSSPTAHGGSADGSACRDSSRGRSRCKGTRNLELVCRRYQSENNSSPGRRHLMVLNIVLFSRARKRVHGLRKMRHRPTAHHAPSVGDTPVQHTTFLLTKHRPLHFDLPPDSLPASFILPQKSTSTAVVRVRGYFHMQKYPTLPPRRRPPVLSSLPDFCLFRDETPCRARAASARASSIRFLPLSRSFVE